MTAMMTIDEIAAAMIAEVEAVALRRLAEMAQRALRRSCEAMMSVAIGRLAGLCRSDAEAGRIATMLAAATPPAAMRAAPVAPARGTMQLAPDFEVMPGGTRRLTGAHWVEPTRLDLDNAVAVEAERDRLEEIEAARLAAGKAGLPGGVERAARRAAPFTSGQVAAAAEYRALVEWREGSPMKCGSLEPGHGGGTSGLFIDGYIAKGARLSRLVAAIGDGLALDLQRRGGAARRAIPVRVAVDMVVLQGASLAEVLRAHGWAAKGDHRAAVREAVCAALDRMQGC